MVHLTTKKRRELVGATVGASAGALFGWMLQLCGYDVPAYLVIVMATLAAMFVSFFFRGETGWTIKGALVGAVIAHFLWSNPKSSAAILGVPPGALLGLIASIVVDLVSSTRKHPANKEPGA